MTASFGSLSALPGSSDAQAYWDPPIGLHSTVTLSKVELCKVPDKKALFNLILT